MSTETETETETKLKKVNLLTTEELAVRWKVSSGHLRNLRNLGGGPPYVRVAARGVRYRLQIIEQWERANAR